MHLPSSKPIAAGIAVKLIQDGDKRKFSPILLPFLYFRLRSSCVAVCFDQISDKTDEDSSSYLGKVHCCSIFYVHMTMFCQRYIANVGSI